MIMMSPHRVAERLDRLYRRIGVGLAAEMTLRGVLALISAPGRDTVFQVTAGWSFPFTMIGGALIMVCHLSHSERPWRYVLGTIGHAFGMVWAFMFGGAIIASWSIRSYICWTTGDCPNPGSASIVIAPIFLAGSALHAAFFYNSVKGAKWTHKQLS